MNDIAQVIGRRIRDRRRCLSLSQTQLAELIGVHQTTISDWERGRTCPSRRLEAKVLEALHAEGTGLFDTTRAAS